MPHTATNQAAAPIDWPALARAFREAQVDLIIREGSPLTGDALTGEALRRAITRPGSPLCTRADADHARRLHATAHRGTLEDLTRKLTACQTARKGDQQTLAQDLADQLRLVNHANNIPSRLRREGVEWAATWLEGHR